NTLQALAEPTDRARISPLSPQAQTENGVAMFRLELTVVDRTQGGTAQERMCCLRMAGRQDEIQMSRLGVLGILDQLLHEAARRGVAAQKIADVLDVSLGQMLDSPQAWAATVTWNLSVHSC